MITKIKYLIIIACFIALISFCGGADKAKNENGKAVPQQVEKKVTTDASALKIPFKENKLSNGMRLITLEEHSSPVVAVYLFYHVGSKNDRPDRRGFAHLFEHMMFRGSKNLGDKDPSIYIENIGGYSNAFTQNDLTCYISKVPSNQLELVFWLESERLGFLKINQEGFDAERNVVAEEYRSYAEKPYGTLLEKILPQIFPNNPYKWEVIGDMNDLKQASISDLQNYWEKYYVPNNATLVVVGDINPEKVAELSKKYFEWIPSGKNIEPLKFEQSTIDKSKIIKIKEHKGPAPIVGNIYYTVPSGHPDSYKLDLLSNILGENESSELYQELVIDKKIANISMSMNYTAEKEGIFIVGAVLEVLSSKKEECLKIIADKIEKMKNQGPSDEELLKAKNNALKGLITNQLSVSRLAGLLGYKAVIENNTNAINEEYKLINSITIEDIKNVAKKYLDPNKKFTVYIEPALGKDKEEAEPKIEKNNNTKSPDFNGKPGLVRPNYIPNEPPIADEINWKDSTEVYSEKLANGLQVEVIEKHKLPYARFFLGITKGAITDPVNKPGTANMAMSMITKGTKNFDYKTLTKELDLYAISLYGNCNYDTSSVYASTLVNESDRAMNYFSDVIKYPNFPQEHLDILREQMKTGKAISEKEPRYLVRRYLRTVIYGDHPYGRTIDGDLKDYDNITNSDLKNWWQSHIIPENCTLYIAGDIKKDDAIKLVKKYFADWKSDKKADDAKLAEFPKKDKNHIYIYNLEGNQTQIRVAHLSITRKDPRFFASQVLSTIFGGTFNSRLNKSIRIEKGLTYGSSGGIYPDKRVGIMNIGTFTKNETVSEAVKAIIDEITKLKTNPPTLEETKDAIRYLTGSFVLEREAFDSLVDDKWLIKSEDLPSDYIEQYLKSISKVTPVELAKIAKELFDEEHLAIVCVGPAKEIKDKLEKIAPVTVLNK